MLLLAVLAATIAGGCRSRPTPALPPGAEAISLLGQPLVPAPIPEDKLARLTEEYDRAKSAYEVNPDDEEAAIWFGRRAAYLGRYREAIDIYTRALARHPESHRLLRHRGHRYITTRRFALALKDLERAAALVEGKPDAIEPDGAADRPSAPRSTDKSNIDYHLGLVLYLTGAYEESERIFARREGLGSYNDDMLVSTTHWRYLALRRLGRHADAERLLEPIREGLDVRENGSYERICKMYKGMLAPEQLLPGEGKIKEAGAAYAVAMFWRFAGKSRESDALLRRIVDETDWISFGHIAAEADLAR